MFAAKRPQDITERDLLSLIENGVDERRSIEYKATLPGASPQAHREFLADASSFANAAGGYIVFGMEEEDGVPTALPGLANIDVDSEILRLETMIRTGVDPRIPRMDTARVLLESGSHAIVMRIPRSWASPHMVAYNHLCRFYSRASNGKYILSVDEIRAAFLAGETFGRRLRAFRAERHAVVTSGDTPVPLVEGPKCVVHIVAADAFTDAPLRNLDALSELQGNLGPLFARSGEDFRHNFDGLLVTYFSARVHPVGSYLQFFRNAVIEAVDSRSWIYDPEAKQIQELALLPSLARSVDQYLEALKYLGVSPPLHVMVSLLGVRGFTLKGRYDEDEESAIRIDRDDLIMTPVMLESYPPEAKVALRPLYDQLWQAVGEPRCPHYDDQGNPTFGRA